MMPIARLPGLILVLVTLLLGGVPGIPGGPQLPWDARAHAQVTGVRMLVENEGVGLGGVIRKGTWTPIRLILNNQGADPRNVYCRWVLNDFDGDQVAAQRLVTLNPNRDQYVWLYGVPPVNQRPGQAWTLQVIDERTGTQLAVEQRPAANLAEPRQAFIGVLGGGELGLEAYTKGYTQHEPLTFVRGLDLTTLPDRWYGLSLVQALIWTRDGGDPAAAEFTAPLQSALREWVRRGGHLIIAMPPVGQTWTASPLADLLPVPASQMRQVEGLPPSSVFPVRPEELPPIQMTVFDVGDDRSIGVLARNDEGEPLIVSKRFGFGRVTLSGLDLADGSLARMTASAGGNRVWNTIFNWQSPVILESAAVNEIREGRLSRPDMRRMVELGAFVPTEVAMTETASPMLLAAMLVFLLYWALAGPISFLVLKRRNATRYSWLGFVAVVAGFTVVTWTGAWVWRPATTQIRHFSVVDVDAQTGLARTQSWMSLFVPRFGTADVVLAPGVDNSMDTLWSPGVVSRGDEVGFLDPRPYTIDAASPNEVVEDDDAGRQALPLRATAKQLQVNFLGVISSEGPGLAEAWVAPQGSLRIGEDSWPAGELQHALPGTLRDVLVVYCPPPAPTLAPGTRETTTPWVWRVDDWPAMQPLKLGGPPGAGAAWIVRGGAALYNTTPRDWRAEGYLGQLIGNQPGHTLLEVPDPFAVEVADNVRVQMIEMLSFYDMLPPPDYRRTDFGQTGVVYHRSLGRGLDLTPLTAGGRVILIGQLEEAPLPAPLTVDGETVPSKGATVVRWIYDL